MRLSCLRPRLAHYPAAATATLFGLYGCGGPRDASDINNETSAGVSAPAESEDGALGDASSGTGDEAGEGAEAGTGVQRLDVGSTTPPGGCDCVKDEFSYLWVANSPQGTVSKIDTRTLEEVGRFETRADRLGNPSRTSVSIDGKAVAVANRAVGITKIWADPARCEDRNGNGAIETSSGATDVLPMADDECIAWFTDFEGMTVQRPVAWTSGRQLEGSCDYVEQKIWTVTGTGGNASSTCAPESDLWVHRLSGDTGEVEDTVHIPAAVQACSHDVGAILDGRGPYGGAVDRNGNFYFQVWGGDLVRVDFDSLDVTVLPYNGYGITVDTKGRVWLSSGASHRFDPVTNAFETTPTVYQGGGSGIAEDHQGRMWVGARVEGEVGLGSYDRDTLAGLDFIALGDTGRVKGVAVDVDGFIWGITTGPRAAAFRIDPDTFEIESYDGLTSPYTYSDMSGGQISAVTCAPAVG